MTLMIEGFQQAPLIILIGLSGKIYICRANFDRNPGDLAINVLNQ